MNRWPIVLALIAGSCSQAHPTPQQCKALADREAIIERCFGGDIERGVALKDEQCWPFSKAERLRGVWRIDLEESEFFPGATSKNEVENRRSKVWLETDELERRPELQAAAQGAGTRIYEVELKGRRALCDGMFGHMGMYKRQVSADEFYSMRLLQP